ncbi:MAG TPA: sodium ion-translocating decarboxylase subunit beta, partial [Bacteroidales bacterium]|nr:sodium ion-translocating decarboxylase subunit beta [Bacteroidales bacterium]
MMKSFIKVLTIVVLLVIAGKGYAQTAVSASADSVTTLQQNETPTSTALIGEQNNIHDKSFMDASLFTQQGGVKLIMMVLGLIFVLVSIKFNFQPLLLVPIGVGMLIANIPFFITGSAPFNIWEENSFFNFFYKGLSYGIYPSLIFIGIGAMTDFSSLIANPKLMLLGAAAQIGIFAALFGAAGLGFSLPEAASVGMIGGADGPISILTSSKLAPHMLVPIAIAAYAFMALVPVIQPPIMRLL